MRRQEYEAVDGNQQTHAERLHFIEMRREALEHIAKDFKREDFNVIQEVNGVYTTSVVCCDCVCIMLLKNDSVHSHSSQSADSADEGGHVDCQL